MAHSLYKLATCKLALAAAGLALFAAPQMASAQGYQPGRVIQAVEVTDLQAIALSLNHTVEEAGTNGPRSIRVRAPGGFTYFMIGTACDQNGVRGCRGLMIQARYTLAPTATLNSLARANLTHTALNVWAIPNQNVMGVTRYVALDGGVTMANLRENVNVLGAIAPLAIATATNQQIPEQ